MSDQPFHIFLLFLLTDPSVTYKYESEDGNLGDLPTVIVIPTHLLDQWIASLHSALYILPSVYELIYGRLACRTTIYGEVTKPAG